MLSFEELFSLDMINTCAYECTRQSRWKETTQRYLSNLLLNNIELRDEVLSGNYKVRQTVDFTLNERGHIRQIEAPVVRDRIVQKTITNNILIPLLRPCLIYDNFASLEMRGTSFARKRFDIMLRRYFAKNRTDGYVLLIDVRKYFNSIDHEVLKQLIAPKIKDLEPRTVDLIHYIIDTSSKTGVGLNLGSEAPQIFAVYYLNPVDQFAKVVKGCKYYGRYMDDIFVLGKTKSELQALLSEIKEVLSKLKLEVNTKKTHIVKLSHGFTYLQVKYNILPSGKIIKRASHDKIVRERRRLKAFKRMLNDGKMTELEIYNCYQSWRGTFIREHNAIKKTLDNMDKLYLDLFGKHEESKEKESRSQLVKQIFKDAETGDLRNVF